MAGSIESAGILRYSSGIFTINGNKIRCTGLEMFFGMNEIPYAVVTLTASDESGYAKTFFDIYNLLSSARHGDPVEVTYSLFGKPREDLSNANMRDIPIFTGLLDGWGPLVVRGTMHLQVWMVHWLHALKTIPAVVEDINGIAMSDARVPSVSADKDALVPISFGKYTPAAAVKNIWANLIKPELERMAAASEYGTELIKSVFQYDKSEKPLDMSKMQNPAGIVLDIRRTLWLPEDDETTIWDKLVRLAARYKFSVIPRARDFSIAPCSYVTGGVINDFILEEKYLSKLQDLCERSRGVVEKIRLMEDVSSLPSMFDRVGRVRRDISYSDVKDSDPARMLVTQLPPWAYNPVTGATLTSSTMGLVSSKLLAAGYSVKQAPDKIKTSFNESYNALQSTDAEAFAQTEFLERLYSDRTAIVHCPLFFDYSPGSTIIMEAKKSGRPSDESIYHEEYGCVRRVGVVLSTDAKRSGSWYVISHLRSEKEQQQVTLVNHPLYNSQWVRAPLLNLPGLVKQAP